MIIAEAGKIMNGSRVGRRRSELFSCGHWVLLAATSLLVGGTFHRPAGGATLQELLAGGSMNIGNSRFSDWQLVALDSTTGVNPDLSQITVTPLANDPSNPGLQFTAAGQLSVAGFNAVDLLFRFRVHALAAGNSFTGHTLSLTGISFGNDGGIAYISNEITNHVGADLGPALAIADNESDVTQFADTSSFSPHSGVFVTTNVFITGLSGADSINLTSFTQRFAQNGLPVLAGDYNQNGAVDAADYTVWRDNVGAAAGALPNDVNGGVIGSTQYETWKAHFGMTSGSAATALQHAAVPEPSIPLLMLMAGMASCFSRRGKRKLSASTY